MKLLKLALTVGMIAGMHAVFTNAQNTQTNWAREFKVKDSVIYADGKPFPMIGHYAYAFVIPQSLREDSLFRFWAQMGGNVHYIDFSSHLHYVEKQNYNAMDQEAEQSAKFGLYWIVQCEIMAFAREYAKTNPDAAMKGPDGSVVKGGMGLNSSFMHEGCRAAIVKALKDLAAHCKDKPYFLGYWLQDEFSYPWSWGGYEAVAVNVFRDKMMVQYGALDKLNAAWGTKYDKKEDILPPTPKEQDGRRWADWQLFRRWAYADLLRVCYQAIKEVDPNHLVINSMDFWPFQPAAASWWIAPPYVDVLQRHGAGHALGFNLMVLREIAEWSGKAGSALCMPPGSSPSFTDFMRLLDASRTGLSYVSAAGPKLGGLGLHYRGAADSDDGFRRREPQYTPAKSIIQLQRYLGDTYLTSKRRPPQVGYLVGDQKVTIAGGNANGIAGMMEIFTDLSLDFEVVSEHNYAPLKRFQAVVVGPEMKLASNEMVTAINKYVQDGGAVILMPGAFEKNEWNEPSSTNLFPLSKRFGKPVSCKAVIADGVEIPGINGRGICPVEVKPDDKVLARVVTGQTNEAAAVISGDGKTLFLGWDVGIPYQQTWSEDFANVGKDDDAQSALLDNAMAGTADSLKVKKADTTVALQPQRRIASWIKDFLATQQAEPYVIVKGHETPGLVHAKSFTAGSDIWVGIANRMVKQGQNLKGFEWDIEKYPENGGAWPADFQVPITNADVFVRLPENFPEGIKCFLIPNMKTAGERITAVPEELPMEIVKTGNEKQARFTINRIDDWAAVVLSPGYRPLAGLEIERREIAQGVTDVKVKMTLLNASDKTIKGELSLKDEDGLCKERPAPGSYELRPGETKTADLNLAVAQDVKTGYYNLKATALGSDGTVAESMGLEVRILDPVTITMKPENGYFYVKPDAPEKVEIKTVLRDEKAKGMISVELEGFTNFVFGKNMEEWTLDGAKEHSFAFTVKTSQTQNMTELGKVIVRGIFDGGLKREWSLPLRVTTGTVTYREARKGQISPYDRIINSADPNSVIEFACLENEHLVARFSIANGVLHNLIVRRTGMELLSPDRYLFGLVWVNRKDGWKLKNIETDQIALSSGPVTMTATLKRGQEFIDVSYDTTGTRLTKDLFYLLSQITRDGISRNNVMRVPLTNNVQELKWQSGGKDYRPEEIAKPWLAVEDKASRHILATFFDIPDLQKVSVAPGLNGRNYEFFYLKDGVSAGKIRFRLFGAQGGIEKIPEWEAIWKKTE